MVLSLLGIVYDVSGGRSFFGPSGPYRIYTGHDASFALATMSLRSIDLDVFDYVLDDVERESLADWLRYFDVKYGRVGRCVDVLHPIDVASLPLGKDPTVFIKKSQRHPSVDDHANPLAAAAFRSALANASAPPPRLRQPSSTNEQLSLSQQLVDVTKDLYEKALRSGLIRSMRQRDITRREYAAWLSARSQVYAVLEMRLDAALVCDNLANPILQLVDNVRLRRLPAIREDLLALVGPECPQFPSSSSAGRYASRISEVADSAHLLALHLWVRYAADLAGAQFLKSALAQGLGVAAVDGRLPGLLYLEFGTAGQAIQELEDLHSGIDAIVEEGHVDTRAIGEMLNEARHAFELDLELNDEFDPHRSRSKL
jgi:membrane-associated progesterone receptor component